MAKIEDNTVSSKNQLSREDSIFGKSGSGKKILFLGNSITRHAPSPSIGWHNDWGMAASALEKDYVHVTMSRVWEKTPDASFLVAQISVWEREFWRDDIITEQFSDAINYNADIIIMRAVENVPLPELEKHSFKDGYINMLNRMNNGNAKIVLTSSFWDTPKRNAVIKEVADEFNYKYVYLSDLGTNDEYTAKGKFEHSGVAAHPGDEGMQAISDRIFDAIEEYL